VIGQRLQEKSLNNILAFNTAMELVFCLIRYDLPQQFRFLVVTQDGIDQLKQAVERKLLTASNKCLTIIQQI